MTVQTITKRRAAQQAFVESLAGLSPQERGDRLFARWPQWLPKRVTARLDEATRFAWMQRWNTQLFERRVRHSPEGVSLDVVSGEINAFLLGRAAHAGDAAHNGLETIFALLRGQFPHGATARAVLSVSVPCPDHLRDVLAERITTDGDLGLSIDALMQHREDGLFAFQDPDTGEDVGPTVLPLLILGLHDSGHLMVREPITGRASVRAPDGTTTWVGRERVYSVILAKGVATPCSASDTAHAFCSDTSSGEPTLIPAHISFGTWNKIGRG